MRFLNRASELGLAVTLRPITASPRAKKTAYEIADQFLRFHYRFVEPARSQLRTSALAATYLNATVLPALDHHASKAWEQICQEHVVREMPDVTSVGRWWGQVPAGNGAGTTRTEEREVDVVGVDGAGRPLAIGMCKWTERQIDFDELNLLERLAPSIGGVTADTHRYLFSRSGFSDRLAAHAATEPLLHLVTPADIYS